MSSIAMSDLSSGGTGNDATDQPDIEQQPIDPPVDIVKGHSGEQEAAVGSSDSQPQMDAPNEQERPTRPCKRHILSLVRRYILIAVWIVLTSLVIVDLVELRKFGWEKSRTNLSSHRAADRALVFGSLLLALVVTSAASWTTYNIASPMNKGKSILGGCVAGVFCFVVVTMVVTTLIKAANWWQLFFWAALSGYIGLYVGLALLLGMRYVQIPVGEFGRLANRALHVFGEPLMLVINLVIDCC